MKLQNFNEVKALEKFLMSSFLRQRKLEVRIGRTFSIWNVISFVNRIKIK